VIVRDALPVPRSFCACRVPVLRLSRARSAPVARLSAERIDFVA